MLTQIAHLGDFHARADTRNPERYRVLDAIIAEAEQLPALGLYVWPGDLNHAKMTIFDKNALRERVQRMASRAPVLICRGNHDEPGDLNFLAHLDARWPILVVDDARIVRLRLATGQDASVFVVAYPDKGRLVGAGVSKADVPSVGADVFEPVFMQASADLDAAAAKGDVVLMIGHLNVAGSRTSVGQPNIGRELELSPRHLDRLGNIPKLLNHIHYGQQIAGAYYAGSVTRQNYGEIEPKHWLVVHVGSGDLIVDAELRTPWTVEERPIDVPPMFHVDGRLDRDGFHPDHDDLLCPNCGGDGDGRFDATEGTLPCAICGGTGQRSWKGCDVRVRYRYQASERGVLNDRVIHEQFAGALRLKVEAIAVPDRDVRAPEVAAARTLPEKVAAYLKTDDIGADMAAALALLEQGDAAAVLADIDAFISRVDATAESAVAA